MPTGPAGGELRGSYPNPRIGKNVIRSVNIKNDAITSVDIRDDTLTNGGLNAQDLAANSVARTLIE